tara:strand:- start:359 stop:928 length:570 start_codon:yes stop_codon:yes gene_type:complete
VEHKAITDNFAGFQGFVEIKVYDGDRLVDVVCTPNIITFTATNIMARTLGMDQSYAPTHMWVGGTDFADLPGVPVVDRTDSSLSSSSDPGVNPIRVRRELPIVARSFLSVPTVSNTSPEQQTSNVVQFTAILPAIPEDGLPSVDGKSFFEAGIITKLGSTNLLFSHQFHAAIEKLNNFQLVYTWAIRFL